MIRASCVGLGLAVLAGCGGGSGGAGGGGGLGPPGPARPARARPPRVAPPAGGRAAGGGWDPPQGSAVVSGRAKFVGEAPKRRPIDMSREAVCAEHWKDGGALDESSLVSADGGLQNVFVWVKKGAEGRTYPPPAEGVVLSQHHCAYAPHVLGVQVGQKLLIRNGDPVMHNVHSFSKRNAPINVGQGAAGAENVQVFERQEVMVAFKCDVHGWMRAWVGVLDHPYFGVTGADGSFTLKGLPPGTYTVEAWHESLGTQTQTVTIGAKESKDVAFVFKAA